MRPFVVAILLLGLSLTHAGAERAHEAAGATSPPVLAISHTSTPTDGWTLTATGLPAATILTEIVLGTDDAQSVHTVLTGLDGTLTSGLNPPDGFWNVGVYRVALGFPDHTAVSALFSVGEAGPTLVVQPAVTSPYSAFDIIGTGLPANMDVGLIVHPANLRPTHVFVAHTDAHGSFSLYIWPEDLDETFFEVGSYLVDAVGFNLSAPFAVYEKPLASRIDPLADTLPGGSLAFSTSYYRPDRYLWGVYASDDLVVRGEFLVGPTDAAGHVQANIPLPVDLSPGHYRLSTPYEWGATDFTVLVPPPTSTPTSTETPTPSSTPTPTATPTATSTPRATRTPRPTSTPRATRTPKPTSTPRATVKRVKRHKKRCHTVHGKRKCTKR